MPFPAFFDRVPGFVDAGDPLAGLSAQRSTTDCATAMPMQLQLAGHSCPTV